MQQEFQSGGSGVGSGSNSSPSAGNGGGSVSGTTGTTPTPSGTNPVLEPNKDLKPETTLADELAANIAAIGALMANPESLQPVAPQAPGNVLTGRFGTSSMMQNWKVWLIVGLIVIAGFWLWKRNKG